MPTGFRQFDSGCEGLSTLGFTLDDSGCNPSGGCPEDTEPGAPQSLSLVHYYNYSTGIPVDSVTNTCGQMNYVKQDAAEDDVEFIATVGERSGFGTTYPDAPERWWQVVKATNEDALIDVDPVPLVPPATFTFFTQEQQGGTPGHADVMCYLLEGSAAAALFDYERSVYSTTAIDIGPGSRGHWCKEGNDFWRIHQGLSGLGNTVLHYTLIDFTHVAYDQWAGDIFPGMPISIDYSDNYIWVLYNGSGASSAIYKLNKTTLAIEDTIPMPNSTLYYPLGFKVINDDFLYLWSDKDGAGTEWRFSKVTPSTDTFTTLGDVTKGGISTNSSVGTTGGVELHYRRGYFYCAGGANTGQTGCVKIGPLLCPGSSQVIGL